MPQCIALTIKGPQCRNIALPDSKYCQTHSSKQAKKSCSSPSSKSTKKPKRKLVARKKPIIYLYPEQIQETEVTLNVSGKLTTTYPKYDNGWQVTAHPNGDIIHNGNRYYGLYWESLGDYQYKLDTGFVIGKNDLVPFLEQTLSDLGLNYKERQEFIVYWLPELEQSEYNLIHFSTTDYVENARLTISPEPDTLIRIFMVCKPLDKSQDIVNQILPPMPERCGFTVVEWGGSILH